MWKRQKRGIFVAATCFVLVAILTVSFIQAGAFLVVDAPPKRADIGLVLAGHFGRAMYAADLYHQGFVPSLSSNSKCNTTGLEGLRCCHANEILSTHEC